MIDYPQNIQAKQALEEAIAGLADQAWNYIKHFETYHGINSIIGRRAQIFALRTETGMRPAEMAFHEIMRTAIKPLEIISNLLEDITAEQRLAVLAQVRLSQLAANEKTPNYRQKGFMGVVLIDEFIKNYGGMGLLEQVKRHNLEERKLQR